MAQDYSDPSRADDPYALSDVEVFWHNRVDRFDTENGEELIAGWYWWSCFPGCLPDGDPMGPFDTEAEALADAQEHVEEASDG